MSEPLLSVCVITYNHAPYILQSLESVASQKVNFSMELIIADDCSKDGTSQIVEGFLKSYKGQVNYLKREKNFGAANNFIDMISRAKGKYIALCEGDDYWTDKHKLQKQVSFLEQYPDYSLCCHDVLFKIRYKRYRNFQWDAPFDSDIKDLLKRGNYISTASVVLKNHPDVLSFLNKFPHAPNGDYLIYISAAQRGKIRIMKEKMAVYRVHSGGTWSQLGIEKAFIKSLIALEMLFEELPECHRGDLKIQLLGMLEVMLRVKGVSVLSNNPDLIRILEKMEISSFLIEYLKFNSVEKSTAAYYSKHIPFRLLMGAIKEKVKNIIFKF